MAETNILERYTELAKLGLPELLEIWKHYDSDGSGYIEAGPELDRFLTDVLRAVKGEPTELEIKDFITGVLDLYDLDADGRLDLGEVERLINDE